MENNYLTRKGYVQRVDKDGNTRTLEVVFVGRMTRKFLGESSKEDTTERNDYELERKSKSIS